MLLFLSLLSLGVGIVFFFGQASWFPSFYHPKVMGVATFIFVFLVYLPRFIFHRFAYSEERQKALSRFERALAFCLLLSVFGTLGLYQLYRYGFEYDKLVHFLFALIMVFAIADFTFSWYALNGTLALMPAMVIVLAGSILWEVIEAFSKAVLGVSLVTIFDSSVSRDTFFDLVFDFLGIVVGLLVFRRKNNFERLSKENRTL